jgi:hypothetical protein
MIRVSQCQAANDALRIVKQYRRGSTTDLTRIQLAKALAVLAAEMEALCAMASYMPPPPRPRRPGAAP